MLNQEEIYQNLHLGNFSNIIKLLHENRHAIKEEVSIGHAVNIALTELFRHIESHGINNEINFSLDLIFIMASQNYYTFKDDHILKLLRLRWNGEHVEVWYKIAQKFPDDPICKQIIDQVRLKQVTVEARSYEDEYKVFKQNRSAGTLFETEVKQFGDFDPYIKVYVREIDRINIIADHIRKLHSVGKANVTDKGFGKADLTIYNRRPHTIEETKQEVELTLENYYSGSNADPIFKEDVISSISDKAYFQVLDLIIRLGKGLESSSRLTEKWDEERYRDYFIPYLNSLSKSHTATGETFHSQGKTDILFRDQNKDNLLIAECKLWKGEVYLNSAINQLFERYVNWRDEKVAIVIFNTSVKGFTEIIKKAIDTISNHHLCHCLIEKRKETSYSYFFRNKDDHQKIIRLELVLFNFV